ncbi:hypothetical protein B0H34DRAFT_674976 [Crassisporium funariophilum]|nr:hypothetical protein B0H34DRAFT_674976 [Crassisporium funariophilum]
MSPPPGSSYLSPVPFEQKRNLPTSLKRRDGRLYWAHVRRKGQAGGMLGTSPHPSGEGRGKKRAGHWHLEVVTVGYHNHPSGGVFAGLRSRDKRQRETKDEKKTEDARNVSSHVSRMSHDRIACTSSTSSVHCIVINAGVLGELYMFHISSIKRMDNGDF